MSQTSLPPSANDLYHEAQRLIREGQPVFPCKSVGAKAKAPLTKNGLHDATLDLKQVRAWWSKHRNASIGIPTGIIWDVLDVDIKDSADGRVHLPYLNKIGLLNGCKKIARSPSGGWHLYFKAAPELKLGNKGRAATLGLDVRGKGGYVLAAPSWVNDGDKSVGPYENMGETIGSTDEPLRWDLIINALSPVDEVTKQEIYLLPSERRASVAALREWTASLTEGERNNGFHWAVSRCIENGIDPHEMYEPATLIGLDDDEINKTIGSALARSGVRAEELDSEVEALFPDDVTDDDMQDEDAA